ncbi:hypothetical protein [Clostridium sp. Marseille-P299]|nr:hypothetical protein [Clostridium sp. Marseille-P299]
MVKSKRVFIMALIVVTVAVVIGAIVYFSGDSKQVLEGTLVYEGCKF